MTKPGTKRGGGLRRAPRRMPRGGHPFGWRRSPGGRWPPESSTVGELRPQNLTGPFRQVRGSVEAAKERRECFAHPVAVVVAVGNDRDVDALSRLDAVPAELARQLGVVARNGQVPFVGGVRRAHGSNRRPCWSPGSSESARGGHCGAAAAPCVPREIARARGRRRTLKHPGARANLAPAAF